MYFTDINDCASNPCLNNGVCNDGLASFTCDCLNGFRGDDCSESKYNAVYYLENLLRKGR